MSTNHVGVQVGLGLSPSTAFDPVAEARRAEALGFDFVSVSDHPCGAQPTYETWTMLTWIAASTRTIGVATKVLGVPYRPPAMVAKMAETLDRFSGGRLVLGLGGGYSDEEFKAFGLPVPTARQKVDGLADAIQISRGLWSARRYTFTGSIYHTAAADLEPKPEHPIPIWLGTYGDRALALTGRLADGWIPTRGLVPPDQVPAYRAKIDAAAVAAGRSPDDVASIYNLTVGRTAGRGAAEALADELRGYVRLGFRGFNLQLDGPDRDEQIEWLGREVIPLVRP
jgi:alkanesulfonate monooxygenase SsuD/methylene tetrahydromethanopterin reductase-like flavin-dependent oxidoreductase (luciferase family)